jgi:hypothetical protein
MLANYTNPVAAEREGIEPSYRITDNLGLASLYITALSTLRLYPILCERLDLNQLSLLSNGFTDHHDSPSSSHSQLFARMKKDSNFQPSA